MTLTFPSVRVLAAALLLLPLAACDETTGGNDTVELTVSDAIAAREGGDVDRAAALLEDAFDRAPENATVRVELATTLLQRDGIDLLDLDRISRFLQGENTAAAVTQSRRSGAECSVADDPTAQEFDPAEVQDFDGIKNKLETIARAAEMLDPVIPDALQSFDVCSSVVDGELVYDRDGAIDALRAQDLSDSQVAQALAVNALAEFLEAYVFIADELPAQTTWYRMADGSITVCVDDEDAIRDDVEMSIESLGETVLSLDARASLLGEDTTAAEIVDQALEAFEDLRTAIIDYCSV